MKKLVYGIALLAFAGCSSYSEIARWDSAMPINDREVPVASFVTQNFSYQLLGFIPLASGVPWTEGDEDICDEFDVSLFSDRPPSTTTSSRCGTRSTASDPIA